MQGELTADWLLARVRDDGTGCLVWAGYLQDGIRPMATMNGMPRYVRRELWKAMTGRAPRPSHTVGMTCETPGCVEPAHLVERLNSHWCVGKVRPADVCIRIALTKRAQAGTAPRHNTPFTGLGAH